MSSEKIRKMIFRSSLVITALLGLFFIKNFNQKPPVNDKEALILQGIMETTKYVHLTPKTIDNSFSAFVYKTYLDRIDFQKRFLTQQDIDKLKVFEQQIDEQTNNRTFEFFNASLPMLDAGVLKGKKYFSEFIDQPMNFSKGDVIETDADKRTYAKNDNELKAQWKNIIQFEVMSKWVQLIKDQEGKENKEGNKTEEELKADAVKDVKKRFTDWFDRVAKLRRSDRLEVYFGSITNYYDPHTDYFSPKDKQDFDINMGGKLEGIGARLTTEGDYTKVFSIVVGGPAWKTKKLDDNDVILKVTQKGKEPVDIAGMRVDDVVQLVRGKKGTTVILTIRKKDNSVVDVSIERDEVQLEDNKAKSVLLNIPGKIQNIGYINLPSFYSSFETEGGNSCAADVAEEIKKLKSQQVNGIILDLRNNGGGSLNDVVDMSGLFIEQGPIVQVKGKESKPFLHVDKDKSVLYSGPLVIMVNQFSASASEIIAAAMQDYNRAIIVGSNSTFGKGTVQRFYDLDRGISGYDEFKPLGAVKMTTQKFYRINGGSTQLKGVVPDIILPDTYHYIKTGEKDYDNPLEWTEISSVPFSQNVVLIENKQKLLENSKSRVAESKDFQMVLESALQIKQNRDQTKYPLKINDYRSMINKKNEESKKFDNLFKNEIAGLDIKNLEADMAKINRDDSNIAKNQEFIKGLKKDIYIEESLFIIRDLINLEKSFVALQPNIIKQ
ncbi:MAG: carboxy terminal-processing peptidase [Saprospiraceae bacterium]|jgi:carboxyl-terminal processing protease|nr:carboxy terminal-processing peptidase [Saprospiraceae bacterium]MBP6446369.1 carboxy terminal-processing peptidase [Saprospiraceae bacterium]